jgi:ketosteroid isomerase-like protein
MSSDAMRPGLLYPLLLALLLSAPACAQSGVVQRCDAAPVRDTSNAVARELRTQYARIAAAMRHEDIDALAAVYAPELTVYMPNGQTWDYEQSLAYSRAGFAQVDSTILATSRIVALRVCGTRATATVLQQWARIQRRGGAPTRTETAAVQDETWTRTPSGWKRARIDEIVSGVMFIDGKPVDPTRPYDPAAPPYDPDAPAGPR